VCTIVHDLPAGFGFRRDDSFPLSRASTPTTLVVRSLETDRTGRIDSTDRADSTDETAGTARTDDWTLGERWLTDIDDWLLSFAERDTA
jgi:hypothetical protein